MEQKLVVQCANVLINLFVCKSHEINNDTLFIQSEIRDQ
jgi:hypothetical protein